MATGLHHEALVYASDEEFLSVAVPFVQEGVAAGEPVLLALDGPLRLLLCDAVEPERVIAPPAGYHCSPAAALQAAAALSTGGEQPGDAVPVRVLGCIPVIPWATCVRYEAAANRVLADLPIRRMCAYDARATADEVLLDVERTHPHLSVPARGDARATAYVDPVAFLTERHRAEGERLAVVASDLDLLEPSATGARAALTAVAAETWLEDRDIDTLCLSTAAVIANARRHGQAPVRLRCWAQHSRMTVTVRDGGPGPGDPFTGLLPRAGATAEDPGTLHTIHQALSDVALYADDTGFTVRLTQDATLGAGHVA